MQTLPTIYQVISRIGDDKDVLDFLRDLCTSAELRAMEERWKVCQLLAQGLSYRQVHRVTKVSLITITRVARSLKDPKSRGYKRALAETAITSTDSLHHGSEVITDAHNPE